MEKAWKDNNTLTKVFNLKQGQFEWELKLSTHIMDSNSPEIKEFLNHKIAAFDSIEDYNRGKVALCTLVNIENEYLITKGTSGNQWKYCVDYSLTIK